MKKLTMELDALLVESFAATPEGVTWLGTVHGRNRADTAVAEHVNKPTLDHTDCPILSCTCSDGAQRFTECDCEPGVPSPTGAEPAVAFRIG